MSNLKSAMSMVEQLQENFRSSYAHNSRVEEIEKSIQILEKYLSKGSHGKVLDKEMDDKIYENTHNVLNLQKVVYDV